METQPLSHFKRLHLRQTSIAYLESLRNPPYKPLDLNPHYRCSRREILTEISQQELGRAVDHAMSQKQAIYPEGSVSNRGWIKEDYEDIQRQLQEAAEVIRSDKRESSPLRAVSRQEPACRGGTLYLTADSPFLDVETDDEDDDDEGHLYDFLPSSTQTESRDDDTSFGTSCYSGTPTTSPHQQGIDEILAAINNGLDDLEQTNDTTGADSTFVQSTLASDPPSQADVKSKLAIEAIQAIEEGRKWGIETTNTLPKISTKEMSSPYIIQKTQSSSFSTITRGTIDTKFHTRLAVTSHAPLCSSLNHHKFNTTSQSLSERKYRNNRNNAAQFSQPSIENFSTSTPSQFYLPIAPSNTNCKQNQNNLNTTTHTHTTDLGNLQQHLNMDKTITTSSEKEYASEFVVHASRPSFTRTKLTNSMASIAEDTISEDDEAEEAAELEDQVETEYRRTTQIEYNFNEPFYLLKPSNSLRNSIKNSCFFIPYEVDATYTYHLASVSDNPMVIVTTPDNVTLALDECAPPLPERDSWTEFQNKAYCIQAEKARREYFQDVETYSEYSKRRTAEEWWAARQDEETQRRADEERRYQEELQWEEERREIQIQIEEDRAREAEDMAYEGGASLAIEHIEDAGSDKQAAVIEEFTVVVRSNTTSNTAIETENSATDNKTAHNQQSFAHHRRTSSVQSDYLRLCSSGEDTEEAIEDSDSGEEYYNESFTTADDSEKGDDIEDEQEQM